MSQSSCAATVFLNVNVCFIANAVLDKLALISGSYYRSHPTWTLSGQLELELLSHSQQVSGPVSSVHGPLPIPLLSTPLIPEEMPLASVSFKESGGPVLLQ